MQIISTSKGGGKTTQAIQMSAATWAFIVCLNQDEASRISNEAKEMGLAIPFPITFSEFLKGNFYSPGIKGFIIDNADQLLQFMGIGAPIMAITITH